jgi:hypothetical protein
VCHQDIEEVNKLNFKVQFIQQKYRMVENYCNKNIGTKIIPKGGKLSLEGRGANASIMHDKGHGM